MDNLLKKGWSGNQLCVMCGVASETVDYLLVDGVVSKFLFNFNLDGCQVLPFTENVKIAWGGVQERGT